MSKKILCLFLCLLMFVAPILTACGPNEGEVEGADAEESTRKPMTLSLWLPTGESTTKESVKQVEAALNSILAAKYDTNIELNLVPEDEYVEKINEKMQSVQDVRDAAQAAENKAHKQLIKDVKDCLLPSERKSGVVDNTSKDANEAQTIIDEYGQKVTVYPEVSDDQLDIFLVKGYDTYLNYIEEEMIVPIEDEVSTVGGSLYNYIYPTFFDLARVEGSLYCVPNNHALDDYEYLLVNKELAKFYNYSGDELTDIIKCESFIKDVYNRINTDGKDDEESALLENVIPLLGTCEAPNMIFIGADNGKDNHVAWSYDNFSVAAVSIGSGVSASTKDIKISLFTDAGSGEVTYGNVYSLMKRLQSVDGIVGDGTIKEGQKFAVGVVEGGAELQKEYGDDYFINIHAVPLADTDDVFGSEDEEGAVFCVSSFTKDASRAVEVITLLNTNEEFRTILQYGIENVNWKTTKNADGKDVLNVINNDYSMNIYNTGNVYLTYPGNGMTKDLWEYSKQQNLESSCNPFIGFTFDSWYDSKEPDEVSQKNLIKLQKKSAEYLKVIENNAYTLDSDGGIMKTIGSEFNGAKKNETLMIDGKKDTISVACLYEFAFAALEDVNMDYSESGKINDTLVGAYQMYTASK